MKKVSLCGLGWVLFCLALHAPLARADDTGPKDPTTAVGQFTSPANVFSSNDADAVEGTVGDTMACYDFNFSGISGTINGILVEWEMARSGTGGLPVTVSCALSWNGGTSFTAVKTNDVTGTTDAYYCFPAGCAATDTWGRTWSAAEFFNANFRVWMEYTSEETGNNQINVDHVRVTVYYTPASGGASPRRNRLFKKP